MKAFSYYEFGDPSVLVLEDRPAPTAGPAEVAIDVEAIGVNFIDTQLRRNSAPFPSSLPGRPHGDVVGVVSHIGTGVDDVKVGDRVAAWGVSDAYAEVVAVDRANVVAIPEDIDAAVATALASTAQVAYGVLQVGRVARGEVVVVHAAAGAIGHILVQLARLAGATVVGTVGSASKADFVRGLGADLVVDYTQPGWDDEIRARFGGVDVVCDSVEGSVFEPSLNLLKPFGRLVYFGFAGAGTDTAKASMLSLLGLKYVVGTSFDAWLAAAPEEAEKGRRVITDYLRSGELDVALHEVLPLAEAANAHRIIENRQQLGRVVLRP
ncbi:quinone oxidoreductase family protein [Rhodococcoides kyotonense]|uniref:NADPH2:quinone reductase n=1 Tax=Rhodococcoides kyotonense TaxID=398843 RepID=A0A239MDB8_9NOCA|nr:zinc-binding dehydrogenase [Rhodococcus kyotonensis]SNT39968.1 NADPH2:quinone reductase [Rhodococcus kyotonensis]